MNLIFELFVSISLDSFEDAVKVKERRRNMLPPVYNEARLIEKPLPLLVLLNENDESDADEIGAGGISNANHNESISETIDPLLTENDVPDEVEIGSDAASNVNSDESIIETNLIYVIMLLTRPMFCLNKALQLEICHHTHMISIMLFQLPRVKWNQLSIHWTKLIHKQLMVYSMKVTNNVIRMVTFLSKNQLQFHRHA